MNEHGNTIFIACKNYEQLLQRFSEMKQWGVGQMKKGRIWEMTRIIKLAQLIHICFISEGNMKLCTYQYKFASYWKAYQFASYWKASYQYASFFFFAISNGDIWRAPVGIFRTNHIWGHKFFFVSNFILFWASAYNFRSFVWYRLRWNFHQGTRLKHPLFMYIILMRLENEK